MHAVGNHRPVGRLDGKQYLLDRFAKLAGVIHLVVELAGTDRSDVVGHLDEIGVDFTAMFRGFCSEYSLDAIQLSVGPATPTRRLQANMQLWQPTHFSVSNTASRTKTPFLPFYAGSLYPLAARRNEFLALSLF
jgi:hypothetical protein